MNGFFAASSLTSKDSRISVFPKCGACGLAKKCASPKLPINGKGRRGILVIGEMPDSKDDATGAHMMGEAGVLLRKVLTKYDVSLEKDCWRTSAIICHPRRSPPPTDLEVDYCRPNITTALRELQPKVVILLGGAAVRSVVGSIWKEQVGPLARWVGWDIPCQKINAWVCPTYNPQSLLHSKDPVPGLMFDRAIEQAVSHEHHPYDVVPDYKSEVECIYDTAKAAHILREMISRGGPVALDYETNRLKPDATNAEIVSCSVCWRGKRTIAYPWQGDAIEATRELLVSPLPKIASNLKFEERWTRRMFGHGARAWYWDTMLASHVIDNRQGITSIKFQSFVMLGSESYDDHIKPLLQSGKDSPLNRVRDIALSDLLFYNALDSLLEYKVAMKQMSLLKYPLPKETE